MLQTSVPAGAADWNWSGTCGAGQSEWHQSCASSTECATDPVRVWYFNNWGQQQCGAAPPLPGATDNAFIGSAGGPPCVYTLTAANHLTIQPGGALEVYAQLGVTGVTAGGLFEVGHDALLWGNTLETVGTGQIMTKHSNQNVLPVPVLRDVTIIGEVASNSGNVLGLDGTITNTGTIYLDGGFIAITGNTTLSGMGLVELSEAGGNYVGGTGSGGAFRLTNSNNTIAGSGILGGGAPSGTTREIAITNNGLIVADQSEELWLRAAPIAADGFSSVINSGTLRATAGATLRLWGDMNFDNTGGVIEALDGSVVALNQGTWIFGGTLHTEGTGQIMTNRPNNSTAAIPELRDVTITGEVVSDSANLLGLRGTINNNGTIFLDGGFVAITGNATLNGAGLLELSEDGGNYVGGIGPAGSSRLTNNSAIAGSGVIGSGSSSGTTGGIAVTNNGLIVADRSEELWLSAAPVAADGLSSFINSGTLRAAEGGTLRLFGDINYDNTSGVIEALDGSVVALDQGAWISGGTLQTSGSGVIRIATKSWRRSWISGVTNQGLVEVPYDYELGVAGAITNNGTIDNRWFIIPTDDFTVDGSGSLVLGDNGQIQSGYSFTNLAGHTVRASSTIPSRIYTPFTNYGRLEVDAGTQLVMQATTYMPQAGATTLIDGTLTLWYETAISGTVGGSGTIDGSVVIASDGNLSPGAGIGALTTGSVTIQDGASYDWQINASGSDLVDVNGVLTFGSAILYIDVAVTSGDVPAEITLFEYDSLPVAPEMSQIVLSAGYSYTGILTHGNRLTLTGVGNPSLLFADDFETSATDLWSNTVGTGSP